MNAKEEVLAAFRVVCNLPLGGVTNGRGSGTVFEKDFL